MNMILQKIVEDAMTKQQGIRHDSDRLWELFNRLLELLHTARNEGILAWEEWVRRMIGKEGGDDPELLELYDLKELGGVERLMADLVLLVVEGMTPDIMEDIAFSKYFASGYEGEDALAACLVIVGVLGVLQAEDPRVLEVRLLSLMPETVGNQILCKMQNEKEQRKSEGS